MRDHVPRLLRDDAEADAELGHDARRLGRDGGGVAAAAEGRVRARADVAAHLFDVRAVVLAVAALETLQDHLRRLDEELAAGVHVDAEAFELDPPEAAPEAEDEAAVRQIVEHADLLGDADRIVPRQHDDHRSEQQRVALAGEVGEHLQHVGAHRVVGEVVLDAPDRLVAERLGDAAEPQLLLVHLEIAAALVGALEDDGESDVHASPIGRALA